MVSSKKVSLTKVLKNNHKNSVKIEKKPKKIEKKVLPTVLPKNEPQLKKTSDSVAAKSKAIERKFNYVMPSKYITENVVNSSLRALEQLAAHHKKSNALFDDEQPIFAEIHCLKIQNSSGNIKL